MLEVVLVEQQTAADTAAARLHALGEQLTLSAEAGLRRTESAIRNDHQSTARVLGALWLRTLAVGLALYVATWSSRRSNSRSTSTSGSKSAEVGADSA